MHGIIRTHLCKSHSGFVVIEYDTRTTTNITNSLLGRAVSVTIKTNRSRQLVWVCVLLLGIPSKLQSAIRFKNVIEADFQICWKNWRWRARADSAELSKRGGNSFERPSAITRKRSNSCLDSWRYESNVQEPTRCCSPPFLRQSGAENQTDNSSSSCDNSAWRS